MYTGNVELYRAVDYDKDLVVADQPFEVDGKRVVRIRVFDTLDSDEGTGSVIESKVYLGEEDVLAIADAIRERREPEVVEPHWEAVAREDVLAGDRILLVNGEDIRGPYVVGVFADVRWLMIGGNAICRTTVPHKDFQFEKWVE